MSRWSIEPGKTRLGWIGVGVMGRWMAGHLLQAGYTLTVYNRSRSKAEPLLQAGAQWADSPRQLAETSEVIFTMVGFPADVREVILGPDGVLAGCSPGKIIVDMTTSQPALAVEIAQQAGQQGVVALDAPVTGGDVGAREGRLSIMIGGDPEAFEALRPCFQCMGKTIVYHGPPGSGQHAKLANQVIIASQMVALCEGLLYAYKAGLDLEKVLQSVSAGAASSWALQNLAPRILAGNFDPGFFVEHFLKDMGIALEEARRMGLVLPGLALAHQLYVSVQALGHGRKGTHALQLALAALSGLDWPSRPTTPLGRPSQKS